MMWFIAIAAAALAFLAGFLSYHVPLFACVVAWLCGVASGVLVTLAGVREGFINWQRTGRG